MVRSSEIATFLRKELHGDDQNIETQSSLNSLKPHSVVFAKKYDIDIINKLNTHNDILAIVAPEYSGRLTCTHIICDNPRLDYMKTIQMFFYHESELSGIDDSAVIAPNAIIRENTYIGAHCYIGNNVRIGENTKIFPNTTIMDNTIIGKNCYIKSGAVIGQPGFGFERDTDGNPIHFPHVGNVVIGDNVYIGANTAIDRGTIDSTVIEDNVKIDNLVHIAHNVHLCKGAFIIAGTILGGGVKIGKNSWIAPNVSIKQQLSIGKNALVGLGAVVLKNVDNDTVVVGNPAKLLKK